MKTGRSSLVLKVFFGSVVFIVIAGFAGTIALRRYLPPERLKELLVTQAQKSLGREVRLKDVSLGLLRGLAVAGLEISEKGGFAKGTFSSIDSFGLNVRWLPLLKGKVVVDAVEVKGLLARVAKAKSGELSVSDLTGPQAPDAAGKPAPPASAGGGLPIELSVRKASLSGARLEYSDAASREKWIVSDLGLKAEGFSLKGPFHAELTLKAEGGPAGKPLAASLRFSGDVDLGGLDKEKLSVHIKSMEASALGWEAALSGTAANAVKPEADLVVALKTKGMEILKGGVKASVSPGPPLAAWAELDLRVPQLRAADLPLSGVPAGLILPATKVTGSVAFSGEDVELKSFAIKSDRAEIEVSGKIRHALSKPDPQVRVAARLELPPLDSNQLSAFAAVPPGISLPALKLRLKAAGGLEAAEVQDLEIGLGASVLSVSGKAQALSSGRPVLDLRVKGGPVVLKELGAIHPAGRELALSGGASVDMKIVGPAAQPAFQGSARLESMGARAAGLELSGFSGSVSADASAIRLESLAGDVSGGRLTVSGSVADYRKEPDIKLKGRWTRLDLGRILAARGPDPAPARPGGPPSSGQISSGEPSPAGGKSEASRPIKTSGSFSIDEIVHPHFDGKDLSMDWSLTGVTPDLKGLSGTAGIRVQSGKFEHLEALTQNYRLAKVLLMPLVLVQKIGKLGLIKGLPDLSRVTFKEILGDYSFERGVMTLRQSRLDSSAGDISSRGKVDLPRDKVEVAVNARVAGVLPLEFNVSGSLADPKVRLSARTFVDPINTLLKGGNPLDKLFKRAPAGDSGGQAAESQEGEKPADPVGAILDIFKKRK